VVPPIDDLRAAGENHLVAFYDSDGFLADAVVRFLRPALLAGDAAVVVATESHRRQFTAGLEADDVDVATAIHERRLILLDAEAMLSSFMVGGVPDPARFRASIGALVDEAMDGRRRVRVYGEMVALLWARDDAPAAVTVEDLWNELAGDHAFALLCAYPMRAVERNRSEAFITVCQQHSALLPHEHFQAGADWPDRRARILETASSSGAAGPTLANDTVRNDFVAGMVEELRTGILQRGQALLADARRTIESIDALMHPDPAPEPLVD
jgi:hypothetical protein